MTQGPSQGQPGFGYPVSYNGPTTVGMYTTDWYLGPTTYSALATVTSTLVPAAAVYAPGQVWEVGFGTATNGAASSTLTATFVLGWTQQAKSCVATVTPTLSSPWQNSSFVQCSPDNGTAITLVWTSTVQNGTATVTVTGTATRVL